MSSRAIASEARRRRRASRLGSAVWPFLILLLGCFALAAATQAAALGRGECRSMPSKILGHPVQYCVILPPSYDSSKQTYPVLYFLHGLGSSSEILINSGGMDLINDLRSQKQIGEFLIVTPDAGRSFYINSRDGKAPYEEFFIHEFIPYIEKQYRVRADREHRGVSGVSMGGYGAFRFAFRYPQLFGSMSAHSAALLATLPTGSASDYQGAILNRILGSAFGSPPDAAYWKENNPFTIVQKGARATGLKIYFDCGTEDDYGFDAGAKSFHELLDSRHITNEFHLYPGGHDWNYVAEHFPASLEFHSRAFGLPGK
jgi:S-formylglutathione hydrolase FrmB